VGQSSGETSKKAAFCSGSLDFSGTPTGWLVTASFIDLEMEIWMENDGHIQQVAAK
jgi:hypothetical protein